MRSIRAQSNWNFSFSFQSFIKPSGIIAKSLGILIVIWFGTFPVERLKLCSCLFYAKTASVICILPSYITLKIHLIILISKGLISDKKQPHVFLVHWPSSERSGQDGNPYLWGFMIESTNWHPIALVEHISFVRVSILPENTVLMKDNESKTRNCGCFFSFDFCATNQPLYNYPQINSFK